MERQPSMKLDHKSSLEAEPQTLLIKEYQLALAALRAYMNGNIEEETDAFIEQVEAMKAAEGKPPLPKAKDGAGPSTSTATETRTSISSETGTTTGSGTGTCSGSESGNDMKLPALT
ncbi:hypothetical protein Pint_08011 [Pistacia integerrima]|uniref:Uncharacterized protein n=1 Tax=Pistacia integerrima TaxID=434235 RepID=A0ACC0XYR9_9ROSI|nr:hypothetical protein Pint_08011 [Pistacia integerrima]